MTGLGAVVFRTMVSLVHNVMFLGRFDLHYDANAYDPPSPWGPGIVLVPVLGGLAVVWLVKTFAPEARGHGVPEVIDSVYFKQGIIRPVVVVIKSLASAISIGSGASVGREGPIIQIGSALGSTIAQWTRLSTGQRITLLSAGAGAGIAATFNTPLGAVLFAVELMMPEISVATFLPVVIATGTATYVGQAFFGIAPAFSVPPLTGGQFVSVGGSLGTIALAVLAGVLFGLASWAFIRGLVLAEKSFQRIPLNDYWRNAIGMGMLGVASYLLVLGWGHPFLSGTGYAPIQEVLNGTMTSLPLLLLLFFGKLAATSISLGSGASGGVFAPSLFMGATLGGAFGVSVKILFPESGFEGADWAMIGMAAVNAGSTGAVLTAAVMVFEMTRDYNIMVPMIVAVVVSVGVRRLLLDETIYTVKLLPRGHRIPKDRHTNMFMIHPVAEVMAPVPRAFPEAQSIGAVAASLAPEEARSPLLVLDGKRLAGVVADAADIQCRARHSPEVSLSEIASPRFVLVRRDAVMHDVLKRMSRRGAVMAVVVDRRHGVPRAADVCGIVTRPMVADRVLSDIQKD